MLLRRATLTAALVATVATLAAHAPVQAQGQTGAVPSQSEQAIRVTPELLDAFADAAIAVTGIGTIWQPKIDAAASKAEAQQIIAQVRDEMRQAVEDTPGITMAEYLAIAGTAKRSPKLAALIHKRMDEKQAEKAKGQ